MRESTRFLLPSAKPLTFAVVGFQHSAGVPRHTAS